LSVPRQPIPKFSNGQSGTHIILFSRTRMQNIHRLWLLLCYR